MRCEALGKFRESNIPTYLPKRWVLFCTPLALDKPTDFACVVYRDRNRIHSQLLVVFQLWTRRQVRSAVRPGRSSLHHPSRASKALFKCPASCRWNRVPLAKTPAHKITFSFFASCGERPVGRASRARPDCMHCIAMVPNLIMCMRMRMRYDAMRWEAYLFNNGVQRRTERTPTVSPNGLACMKKPYVMVCSTGNELAIWFSLRAV